MRGGDVPAPLLDERPFAEQRRLHIEDINSRHVLLIDSGEIDHSLRVERNDGSGP